MSAQTRPDVDDSARGFVADLTATFAGVLLLLTSAFDILQGGSAVANDDLYAQGSEYLYKFDMTAWGWVHIILGVLGLAVGVGILRRASWGQITGIMIASLSMLTNFMFLPVYPVWSAFIIGFNAIVIWALCAQLKTTR
ncbi:DUF7144 family membrane protein [Nocardioides sp. URHA0020]|uniref:DUF7144 family membrane protein n=1 Tax=Nocardioides sp. URHA0020 TaxID=1380392 RepID=UPI00048DCC9B|nr:hypothetical protein [Nocardioides sp. URHA0020]